MWLALVLALAAALRFWHLGQASLQVDEAVSWLSACQGFQDVHPPLFPWMLRCWSFLGQDEASLRTLAVLPSLASVLLLARWAGPGPALLLACSWADLQQARELRMYSWLQLWVVLHWLSLLQGRKGLAGLSLLGALYTHLFGLFLIPLAYALVPCPQGGSASPETPLKRMHWLLWVQALALLLWLPWAVPHYLSQGGHPLDLRQAASLSMVVEAIGRLACGQVAAFGAPLSLGLGVALLLWLGLRRPRAPLWVYAWALGPWLLLGLVSGLTPLRLFEFKYLLWCWPAWCLLIAREPWLLRGLLVLNLWLALPWLDHSQGYFADWRGVAQRLRVRPELVAVHPSMMGAPLLYYGIRPLFVDEATQLPLGRPLLWVTTPHHPFVVRQGLIGVLQRFCLLEQRWTFPCQLPSGVLEVSLWREKNLAPQFSPEREQHEGRHRK